ncbi:TonB-dependent receptor [Chitinophaga polysaccharea]|uniref:outer membrane beta-barrel family protein n=1 Tax=Chitinophaga polysaccharea TaxID=1293035 RepID=UPI001455AF15|nr:outer membrane beta-barrel family protein [Chitinophaga polysaccharea]NLR57522.1 TonB-dependent receptor [Chitinophaga polysaccharea]
MKNIMMTLRSQMCLVKQWMLLALLILPVAAGAQTGKVTGQVRDEAQQPVVAATILLKKATDSSLVKVALSDTTGAWLLEDIPFNRYFITITYMGYKEWNGPVFNIDQSQMALENAILQTGANNLKGVTVAAKKPFIEQQLDRTVVNVESSIMAAGGSAMEVMEKLPGVLVDKNGNISIKGKQGVKVMIDDRPAYLSGGELTAFLRNMPASQLDQIEIMSNPPAKYDAAGNGVINIKRKKLKTGGFNGNITLTALQGRYPGTTQSLNFNYSNKHINFYGNAGYSYRKSFEDYYIVRNFRNADQKEITSIYDQHTYTKTTAQSVTAKLGLDYYVNAKTTVGIAAGGFHNPSDASSTNNTLLKTGEGVATTRVDAPATTKGKWDNMEANVSLKHVFGTAHELLVNADYLSYNSTSKQHFDNHYYKPDSSEAAPNKLFLADLPAKINIYSLKADYTHPFSEDTRLEAGAKTSFVNTDNNAQYYDGVNGSWIKNDTLSNHFLYKENINAAYLNLRHKRNQWEFQAGLRAEQTWLKGEQKNNGQTFSRSYLQFFPTAFLAYDVDKQSKVTFSYGRRIERPDYRSMNPFRFYLDQYTYDEGNPYLNPQYSHNFELSYSIWEGALTTTLLYNKTTDIIQEVILQDAAKNETYQRPENLNTRKVLGANINAQIPLNDNMTTIIYMDYNHYDYSGTINNGPFQLKAGVFTAQLMQQVKLKDGWGFQFMGTWSSRSIDGTFLQQPIGTLHAGIQKDVLGKQGTIRLSASDIFAWSRYNATSRYQNIDIHIRGQWQSQVLKLAFTYRFNKNDKKDATDKRESGAAEEQKRVKTEKQ